MIWERDSFAGPSFGSQQHQVYLLEVAGIHLLSLAATMPDETTPLLHGMADLEALNDPDLNDPHRQFCMLAGVPPSNEGNKHFTVGRRTLYGRATRQYASAKWSHAFMASFSNTLLLSQVVLGAALTALGASESSHILITIFGAMNTIIAGLVAYLKSRGQPMRTRMFRDDMAKVVDEIEDSEIMWFGISQNIHGYDEIDVGDKVTVRSEVARLMRIYEKAIRANMLNNPDNYLMGLGDNPGGAALRSRPAGAGAAAVALPVITPDVPAVSQPAAPATPAPAAPPADPDEAPASAPPKPDTPTPDAKKDDSAKEPMSSPEDDAADSKKQDATEEPAKDDKKPENTAPTSNSTAQAPPTQAPTPADPDASPATTDAGLKKEDEEEDKDKRDVGKDNTLPQNR